MTEALMSAIPPDDPDLPMDPVLLKGEPPSPSNPPTGCSFHTRCHYAQKQKCSSEVPQLEELFAGHFVACHYAQELGLKGTQEHYPKASENLSGELK